MAPRYLWPSVFKLVLGGSFICALRACTTNLCNEWRWEWEIRNTESGHLPVRTTATVTLNSPIYGRSFLLVVISRIQLSNFSFVPTNPE